MRANLQDVLRQIPAVDEILQAGPIRAALARHPRKLVLESIRQVLDMKRERLRGHPDKPDDIRLEMEHLVELILDRLETLGAYTLQTVINATGIIIHTNLGRSILPEEAVDRLQALCRSYSNLEYDLQKGRRGSRYVHAESILREISGAEAALVVNNNAGAVLLVLSTLAAGREVVVSRGQLVEIGGSFRIPDVMKSSGAILREVGCTNRTHLRDYEAAINEQTALLLKVHCSNYRIIGFTSEVPLEELVELGRWTNLPVMEDLGSGSFVDLSRFGLQREPTVQEAVRARADIVTFSGDKLLGGPQAGIIVGRKELVDRCKNNPLTRALRVDKMTLAALEAVLRLYRDEERALESIPTLQMIKAPVGILEERAHELAARIQSADVNQYLSDVSVREGYSQVGGGSLPGEELPTYVVAVHSHLMSTKKMEQILRKNKPPIIGRIESDNYLMDVRTIRPGEIAIIEKAFERLLRQSASFA